MSLAVQSVSLITTNSDVSRLFTKGYFVERGVLDQDTIETVERTIPALIKEDIQKWGQNPNYFDANIAINLMLRGKIFREILTNPRLIAVVDEVLGPTSILNAYNGPCTPAGDSNHARRIHTDCPPERVVPGFITNLNLVIAISPFTKDKGATYYLPGSMNLIEKPSEEEFYADAVQVELQPGDAIFFNAHLWHAAGVNNTAEDRFGLGMNFVHSYMRQRFDYPRMISPELEAQLTELERRLLGFNVRTPSSLEEFYVEPAKRLYLANQG